LRECEKIVCACPARAAGSLGERSFGLGVSRIRYRQADIMSRGGDLMSSQIMFVFDFDGVLADSSALCLDLLRWVHADFGLPRPSPDDLWHRLDDISFPAMARYLGVPAGQQAKYLRRIFERMVDEAYRHELFDGVDGVLRALAQEGPVAILSASPAAVIEMALDRAGLSASVAGIRDGRDPASKTAKLPGLLDQFGASPSQAVMVGDATSDIRAGQANGMRTAAVTWGWQRRDLLAAAGPDWIFTRVETLLTLPERLRIQAR
jgi:phosphoglycolate phosphatase